MYSSGSRTTHANLDRTLGRRRWRPFERLGPVAQNMLRYLPAHDRDQYAFDEVDDSVYNSRGID